MKIENIGVMSPGDMGQAIAQQLKQKGYNVCTALDKRSARSQALARDAGLTGVGSIGNLMCQGPRRASSSTLPRRRCACAY